jgi:hypothetical protein
MLLLYTAGFWAVLSIPAAVGIFPVMFVSNLEMLLDAQLSLVAKIITHLVVVISICTFNILNFLLLLSIIIDVRKYLGREKCEWWKYSFFTASINTVFLIRCCGTRKTGLELGSVNINKMGMGYSMAGYGNLCYMV